MSTLVWNSWSTVKTLISKLIFLLGLGTALYLAFSGVSGGWGSARPAESNPEESPRNIKQFALAAPQLGSAGDAAAGTIAAAGFAADDSASPTKDAAANSATPEGASPSPEATADGNPASDAIPEGQPGEFSAPAMPYLMDSGLNGESAPQRGSEQGESKDPLFGGAGGSLGAFGSMGGGAAFAASSASSSGGVDSTSTLTSQDLQILATPLKTMFSAPNSNVSGVYYPAGDSSTSTSQVSASPISTTRWNLTEGIRQDGAFTISGPDQNNLSFVLGLNFQTQGAPGWQNYASGTGVISTKVRTEFRNGHPFRIFEFKLASFQIKPGDMLRQVSVLLAMDVFTPGSPQVSNESRISFVRTHAKASSVAWPTPVNPASDPYVIADEIPYSIELQNAP